VEVIGLGRQDWFSEPQSCFRSAYLICGTARLPGLSANEAKFWIAPAVELAANFSLKPKRVTEGQTLIEEHLNEIHDAWAKHFPSQSHRVSLA